MAARYTLWLGLEEVSATDDLSSAENLFKQYKRGSRNGYGKAAGRCVTLFDGAKTLRFYPGDLPCPIPKN